jgi:hypothetical protein
MLVLSNEGSDEAFGVQDCEHPPVMVAHGPNQPGIDARQGVSGREFLSRHFDQIQHFIDSQPDRLPAVVEHQHRLGGIRRHLDPDHPAAIDHRQQDPPKIEES